MAVTSSKCAHHACRRIVRSDNPSYPYCYQHQRDIFQSEFRDDPYRDNADLPEPSYSSRGLNPYLRTNGNYASLTEHDIARMKDDFLHFTELRPEYVEPVIRGCSSWTRGDDLSIPSVAIERAENEPLGIRDAIRDAGVPISSLDRVRFRGISRSIMKNEKDDDGNIYQRPQYVSDEDYTTDVLVIDYGTPYETVVDPTVNQFAPVSSRRLNTSVHDIFPSGENQFTDEIWIGSVEGYTNSPLMTWDSHSRVPWA